MGRSPLFALGLRTKVLCVAVGAVLLLGAVTTIFVRRALERALLSQLETRGLTTARHLAAGIVELLLTEHYLEIRLSFQDALHNEPDLAYLFALSPGGEVIAHTFSGGFPAALKSAGATSAANPVRRLLTGEGAVLDVTVPLLGGDMGVLRLGMSEAGVRAEVARTVRAVAWIVVGCTLAAAALAVILELAISAPLVRLASAADEVRAGNFPPSLSVGAHDEVGRLASAFNAMVIARKDADAEQQRLIGELREALASVRMLQGLLPICSSCKKVRDDQGYWSQIESYISTHADVQFTHSLCPVCLQKHYPDLAGTVAARLAKDAAAAEKKSCD